MTRSTTSRLAQAAALLIFFCSGMAGLAYEISWSRQFGNVFGHTVFTAANVLFSFMGGMALGYWLAGRSKNIWPPLWAYGWMEIFAGAWALAVPVLLILTSGTVVTSLDPGPLHLYVGMRSIFCFIVLLPSTACLGATWPLMAAFLSPDSARSPLLLSWAYALNTAGSLIGSYVTTVYLLVKAGVVASSLWAAAVSIVCGLMAIVLSRMLREVPPPAASVTEIATTHISRTYYKWLALAALSGFAVLALEVLYFRLFSLVFHNSTYTFGAVVTVFLFALALGSAITGIIGSRNAPKTIAAIVCGIGAVGIAYSLGKFVSRTEFQYFSEGTTFASYSLGALKLVAEVIVLPITALGMILPLAWRALNPHFSGPTQVAGLTAASTISAALGSLAASFVLLPYLGLWGSFAILSILYFALASVILLKNGLRIQWLLIVFMAIATVNWGWDKSRQARTLLPGDVLVQHWDSPYGWVDVVKAPDNALAIRQNLHYAFGSSIHSVHRDYRQGHIPLLLHGDPKSVVFLGMGTGQTAAAALRHPELKSIVVVELIKETVEAARLFADTNLGLVDHPRVQIKVDDARRYLSAGKNRYDVIVADLFVPWESHTGYLYTVEHYQAARSKLNPGGLFCQWLPLYQTGPGDFELIADSFASVFPNVTVWWVKIDAAKAVLGLVGSEKEIDLAAAMKARASLMLQPGNNIDDDHLKTDEGMMSLYIGQWIIRNAGWYNTDEHPRVEFSTPISHVNNQKLSGWRMRGYYSDILGELPDAGIIPAKTGGRALDKSWRKSEHQLLLLGMDPSKTRPTPSR